MNKLKIILASQSPRRKELLSMMGVNYEVMVSYKEEIIPFGTSVEDTPKILAKQKALDIFEKTQGDRLIIGSDTIVTLDGVIYGKPNAQKPAQTILKEISGRTHEVITGLCVIVEKNGKQKIYSTICRTKVKMKKLTDKEIEYYCATKEPYDKAGAYALQGIAGMFIEKINGNMASVIGLPTNQLYKILKKEGIYD